MRFLQHPCLAVNFQPAAVRSSRRGRMALLSTALLLTTGLGRTPDEYWGKVHVQSYPENWRQPEVPADHRAEGAEDNNPIDQPIHEACRAGDLERIKLLVKAGARIDAPERLVRDRWRRSSGSCVE
ncbi:hypothetical protein FOZ63_011268, partial [Perkinsus olseni]